MPQPPEPVYRRLRPSWLLLIRLAFFSLALLGLTELLRLWGGLGSLRGHPRIELPLLLLIYLFCLSLMRPGRGAGFVATIPVLLGYAAMDMYFLVFGRVFRLSELNELPELFSVLPWHEGATLIAMVMVPMAVFVQRIRPVSWWRPAASILPLAALWLALQLWPGQLLDTFAKYSNGVVEWSDAENARWNGRFTIVLYQEAKRQRAMAEIAGFGDDPDYQARFDADLALLQQTRQRRNLHILVLEGFIDPEQIQGLSWNTDPVAAELRELLVKGQGDLSISPVWGGYTAQAEFEILCGAPALRRIGSIEFNAFQGAPVNCLPRLLRELDYQTIATHGFKPNFFNSAVALRSLGFEEVFFAREYAPGEPTYFSTGDVAVEEFMTDQKLLSQNLDFVRERLQSRPGQPLLNYVLTIYGHYPYRIDEHLRPRVIDTNPPGQMPSDLAIVVNQIHYRSQALADYLRELIALDPAAVILLVADHLPPLEQGRDAYRRMRYLGGDESVLFKTLLAVIDQGRPVPVGTLHQHQIPALIYRLLTDGAYCEQERRCEAADAAELERRYLQIMARAIGS